MLGRAALLILLGAVCACDAPPQDKATIPPPAPQAPAVVLSERQVFERSTQCGKTSRDEFRRAWDEGTVKTGDELMTADFTYHYNAKLDTCFYLLTVNHSTRGNGRGGAAAGTIRKMLVDINERELYGEYLGPAAGESPPAASPTTCRVISMYCASEREWHVLVGPFIED